LPVVTADPELSPVPDDATLPVEDVPVPAAGLAQARSSTEKTADERARRTTSLR
jgi:hypothetical protein